uniref:Uncharacterized protein n=1 Tax=Globodera rostochiensis TaxID=31243 RepID=A0A914HG90_GLORO
MRKIFKEIQYFKRFFPKFLKKNAIKTTKFNDEFEGFPAKFTGFVIIGSYTNRRHCGSTPAAEKNPLSICLIKSCRLIQIFAICHRKFVISSTRGVELQTNTFQQLSEGKRYRYIIYKIVDKEVIVEVAVSSDDIGSAGDESYDDNSKAAYESFVKDLKERTEDAASRCRHIQDGQNCLHPALPGWCFNQEENALRIILQFQVSDESEIAHKELLGKLNDKYRDN